MRPKGDGGSKAAPQMRRSCQRGTVQLAVFACWRPFPGMGHAAGDQSLFTSDAAVERLWEISAPLLDNPPPIQPYTPGSWGPQPALDHLTGPYHWHLPPARSSLRNTKPPIPISG